MNKIILGKIIRIFHSLIPYIIIVIILYGSQNICKYTIFFVIGMLILFIYLEKCIISKYEQILLNDNITVVDIYLKLFYLKINKFNRKYVSLFGILFLLIVVVVIYYFRFIHK